MITPPSKKSDRIKEIIKNDGNIILKSEQGLLRISVFYEDVIRVSFTKEEDFSPLQGDGILVQTEPVICDFSVDDSSDTIKIKTNQLVVKVCRETGSVKVYKSDDNEKPIFCEAPEQSHVLEKFDVYKSSGQIKTEEIKTADGIKKRVIASDKEYVESLYHTTLNLNFAPDEKLFGLGQAEEGVWNLRGTTQYLHQANKKLLFLF